MIRRQPFTHFGLIVVLLLLGSHAEAAEPWASLEPEPTVRVTGVVDGDTVTIDPEVEGASEIRLVGIQAPKIPLGRKNFKTWPYGETAREALIALLDGRSVDLFFGGHRMDRHGRLLAHLRRDDGLWIQGEMLALGLARVYSFPDNRAVVDQMLAAEQASRDLDLNIWRHPFYDIRTPDNATDFIGRFELVQGVVHDVADRGKRIYVNFTDDWRTDFTLTIKGKAKRLFREAGLDPLSLKGRLIRARGWLKSLNGPMINLTHPEQIEILD